jgi:hypothetical protein
MATGKRAGRKSQSSNDFLAPLQVEGVTSADVGLNRPFNDGAIETVFSLPSGSPAATSYTITATNTTSGISTTATGTSAPITVTGLEADRSYTIKVKAENASGFSEYTLGSPVFVTTVPSTPGAPIVSSPAGTSYDTVTWQQVYSGGKSITGYSVESNDGKSGTTTNTTININQEGGTTQAYRVKATNANGDSQWSSYSGNVTTFSFTPFSFTPFSPFGFVPYYNFGFTPYYNFGFTPFSPFSFVPWYNFGFTPFNFVPFAFTPFNFVPR